MTMPHLMNCPHADTGHCLDCVHAAHDDAETCIAAAVAAEREACACADDFNGVTADDLRAAIRARGGEVARETECRCGHSHAAHKGTGYSCLGSASPRESCDCRLFVKRDGQ